MEKQYDKASKILHRESSFHSVEVLYLCLFLKVRSLKGVDTPLVTIAKTEVKEILFSDKNKELLAGDTTWKKVVDIMPSEE